MTSTFSSAVALGGGQTGAQIDQEGSPANRTVGLPIRQPHSWNGVTVSEHHVGDGDFPQQTARRTALTLQMSGLLEVEFGLNGRFERRPVAPGNFCIAPAGGSIASKRWRGKRLILLTELSPALVRSVAESHNLQSFELLPKYAVKDPRVSHLLLALWEEYRNQYPSGRAYVDTIARAITIRLLRAYAATSSPRIHRGGLSRPLLRRVIEYIDAHLGDNPGLRSLAAAAGLSEDHFARAFRQSTGVPPHRYLLQRRLDRARQLLEASDMPIVEIAHSLGFTDQSHLTKLFRRETGTTPGQLRSRLGRNPEDYRNPTSDTGILQEATVPFRLLS